MGDYVNLGLIRLKNGCLSASAAVILYFGSILKIFFMRSIPYFPILAKYLLYKESVKLNYGNFIPTNLGFLENNYS